MSLHLPKTSECMNILVLGETGVGKSTFINGLVNYLNYETMDDALEEDVKILIRSSFTLTDQNYQTREILSEPNVAGAGESARTNENLLFGQSATQEPKSYLFTYHDGSRKIRIIDTPGIGDTRGIEQDKKNFEKILTFISGFSELHAICILIKPNSSRLTLSFRFCIDELLVHLHKSAARNILFCFTNTRGTLYKPGDTLPTLREHLKKLEDKRGIIIPLDGSTLFSFDNESFRFLCAKKEGFPFSPSEEDSFESSWTKSVEETQRLFDRISQLPVHRVHDTLSLNNTRNVILSLTRPLAEIARVQMINMALINEKTEEIERLAKEGKSLKGQLYVEQVMISPVELPYPSTVCTNKSCVEYKKFSSKSSEMQTIYKTICHDHCHLVGVQVENCPNTELQKCWAMDGSGQCRICGCEWNTHMHIRYKLDQTLEKVIDEHVKQSIDRKESSQATATIFLENERTKVKEMKAEQGRILQCCATFGSFLSQNSMMPYNDSYGEYVDHLIKEEKDKVAAGGGHETLDRLMQYKMQYTEEKNILDCNASSSEDPNLRIRISDIEDMVDELRNLKHCGRLLDDLKKVEMLTVKKSSAAQSVQIPVKERKQTYQNKQRGQRNKTKAKRRNEEYENDSYQKYRAPEESNYSKYSDYGILTPSRRYDAPHYDDPARLYPVQIASDDIPVGPSQRPAAEPKDDEAPVRSLWGKLIRPWTFFI